MSAYLTEKEFIIKAKEAGYTDEYINNTIKERQELSKISGNEARYFMAEIEPLNIGYPCE